MSGRKAQPRTTITSWTNLGATLKLLAGVEAWRPQSPRARLRFLLPGSPERHGYALSIDSPAVLEALSSADNLRSVGALAIGTAR